MINIMQVVSKRKLLNHFVISILLPYTICKTFTFKIHLLKMEFYEGTYINWTADIETIKDCNLCITVPLFLSAGRLHDVDFIVWSCPDHLHSCGRYIGPAKTGERIVVFCPKNTVGHFVQLQIVKGEKNEISPVEVRVWGKPTTKEWYYRNINSYMEIILSIYKFIYGYQDIHVSNKI